uniref:Translation initiation factor if 2 n=1 Tax=Rhipicephalus appendiculatus TaxID=34631 RepID=A0A131Z2V6_RHIAP
MSEIEEATGNCDTGGDVDFAADFTGPSDWDDTSLEQTAVENEEVQNGDAVTDDAEAGAVDDEKRAEATETADGETEMEEKLDETAGETGAEAEKQGGAAMAAPEGAEGEPAAEEKDSAESKSGASYTCDMCKETFEETEEEHLKGRKHLKLLERLEKFGTLEAVAAEFQASVCYLCDVSAVSKSQMAMHVKGAKHRLRCANLKLPPSALDLPGTNRAAKSPTKTESKSAGPPDPNAVMPERPVCDVCNITLSSVHQLVQHLSGKRHKEIVNALKQAILRIPPNLRPPQLRTLFRKNDGKPPTGPAVKPAAPAPKPGIAVQGPAAKGVKRPAPPAGGAATGPVKKPKQEPAPKPSEDSGASTAPSVKLSCDICNVKLNSDFQRTEHFKGKPHMERLAELKGGAKAGANKPGGPQQKAGTQKGPLLGNRSIGGKQAQKVKGQQQSKPAFWSNVGQRSELQYAQRMGGNRPRESVPHVGRGPLHPAVLGKGGFGGPRHQVPIQHDFAPSGRHYRDEPHPASMWPNSPVQPQWKSPVLPEPAPSAGFGLLDPPGPDPREQGPYGLTSPQQFSKLQLDLALEISKLSQHLSRPEFSKELSQQLSHHISQELSRHRQMATDRPGREDFMPDEFPPLHSERLPLLGDTLPLLEKRPLLHDQPPLLPDKGPLLRDSYDDHAPRRPPLLGDSRPGFDDREQGYHFERRDERRPGIDSYGERRSRDYSDDYGKAYGGGHVRDLPPREPEDYRRSAHSSSGGLLGRPPLLGSRF